DYDPLRLGKMQQQFRLGLCRFLSPCEVNLAIPTLIHYLPAIQL
ncbi:MAG: hypothetical protein ACI9HA_003637, partial [Dinoroseobacter sp.]